MDDFLAGVSVDEGTGSSTFSDVDLGRSWYSDVWDWVSDPKNFKEESSIASGLYGLYQSNQQMQMGRNAVSAGDPFGSQRGQYQQQLAQLMANPSSVFEDEGYKASLNQGLGGVERLMASKGLLGSGNEAAELEKYGQTFAGDYLQQRIAQLSGLAGAGFGPNPGPGLSAYNQGVDTASQSLATLGYGIARGGSSAGTPQSGGFRSAGGEAAGAIKLAQLGTKAYGGATGANVSGVQGGLSGAGNVLGVYQGIQQGGVGGYLSAAKSGYNLYNLATSGAGASVAAQFGSGAAANAALAEAGFGGAAASGTSGAASAAGSGLGAAGTALGVAGAAYGAYNTVKAWNQGNVKGGAVSGASTGAAVGTMIVPGIGTVVGALIGGAVGAVGSMIHGKEAAEDSAKKYYFDAQTKGAQPGQVDDNTFTTALVGEFRSGASGFPPKASGKYGKNDDDKFAADMAEKINSAYQSGTITSSDSPDSIYSKVIDPWFQEMGGFKRQGDIPKLKSLTVDMITRYTSGRPITWQEAHGGQPQYAMPKYSGQAPLGGSNSTINPNSSLSTTAFQNHMFQPSSPQQMLMVA